jgi:hypothetical protein
MDNLSYMFFVEGAADFSARQLSSSGKLGIHILK